MMQATTLPLIQHHNAQLLPDQQRGDAGFSSTEAEIVANVARYHRKSPSETGATSTSLRCPGGGSMQFGGWQPAFASQKGSTAVASSGIHRVCVRIEPERIVIEANAEQDVSIELWGARRRVALLEELSERPVVVESRNS